MAVKELGNRKQDDCWKVVIDMKRMTVHEIDRFIAKLKSTESVGGVTEQEKTHAIRCLESMLDDMEFRGMKSLRIQERGEECES